MQIIPLQIEALAPLAFPERKPGTQFNSSLPYIPGAAIYGALGAWFNAQGIYDEALFRVLRCHNAYPARVVDDMWDSWVRPLPTTAIQPKGSDEENVKPHDSLYERICWEHQEPTALIYAPTDDDGRPWEAASAKFYALHESVLYHASQVQQRVLTRVAINRQRGTAEEGRLYSPLAISEVTLQKLPRQKLLVQESTSKESTYHKEPTRFLGSLIVPDAATETITAALAGITHLGARQTSGLGAVAIVTPDLSTDSEDAAAIQGRSTLMTQRFQAQAALYAALGGTSWEPTATTIFTINLLSDTILLDHGWLPTQAFSPQLLKEATGIEATLLRSFTTTKTVGGWQVLWQRPKPTAVALAMGGMFVFQAKQPLDEKDCQRLTTLQHDGIGERRAEGFGQIRICDEFHVLERGTNP